MQSMSETPVKSVHGMKFATYGTMVLKTRESTSSEANEVELLESNDTISEMTITFSKLKHRQSMSIMKVDEDKVGQPEMEPLELPLIKMQRCIP